ncbi:MAG: CDP-diacylglycerol--serine O-phosphatidyltransferase [Bacteroidales bacterium]
MARNPPVITRFNLTQLRFFMNAITKHIPNAITCLNLFSGCMSAVASFNGDYKIAMYWIFAAAIFDFFDGFAARLLKAYSPMGKEMDSLADCISFGFAPAIMLYSVLSTFANFPEWIKYIAFLLAVFSALRLAKFNIDERQTTSFIGLPTPANALFWITLINAYTTGAMPFELPEWVIVVLIPVFSYLLISEVPMFSLKLKSLSIAKNKILYSFLVIFLVLILIWGYFGVALGMIFYVFLSALTARKE